MIFFFLLKIDYYSTSEIALFGSLMTLRSLVGACLLKNLTKKKKKKKKAGYIHH